LRTGKRGQNVIQLAQDIIKKYRDINVLSSQSVASLINISGIGKDKAATIVAAFELSRRVDSQKKWFSNKKITSPSDIAEIFIPLLRDQLKEQFIVVCLSSSNKIVKYETISVGSLNASVVHPREIFKVAIDCNSANIILLHNHPSGNVEPSNEDLAITQKIVDAGKLLDIHVFDHLIIAGNKFTSLVEKRLIL